MYEAGNTKSDELHEKMNRCVEDDRNTMLSLCELEEEPSSIVNLKDVETRVNAE